jgi:hypothetical protein
MKLPKLRRRKIRNPQNSSSVFVFNLQISDENLEKIKEVLSRHPHEIEP